MKRFLALGKKSHYLLIIAGLCTLFLLVMLPEILTISLPSPELAATYSAATSTAEVTLWTPLPTRTLYPTSIPIKYSDTQAKKISTPYLEPDLTPTLSSQNLKQFSTPKSTGSIVNFAVIGSYGWPQKSAMDVSLMVKGWKPDFITTTGNNSMITGDKAYIDSKIGQFYNSFIYPYYGKYGKGADKNRFFPALGLFDYASSTKEDPYLSYFTLPGNEHFYDVRWGVVHLFILDSIPEGMEGLGKATKQGLWLKNSLSASDATWKIVIMFHSPYSSGKYFGSNPGVLLPFKEWGADAVISGADQTYERIMVNNFPFINNGLGLEPKPFNTDLVEGSVVRYNEAPGAMYIRGAENYIVFKFIDINGRIVDNYMIKK